MCMSFVVLTHIIIKYQNKSIIFPYLSFADTLAAIYDYIILVASSNGYLTHILYCNYILSNINLESHNFHIAK